MLKVSPITDINTANKLDEIFDYSPEEGTFRFLASDINLPNEDVNHLIGYSVCVMNKEKNEISLFKTFEGVDDDEAMIIMARTVMNFMYRCEVKTVYLSNSISPEWRSKLGFKNEDGKIYIDLEEFYKSPCKYTSKNN